MVKSRHCVTRELGRILKIQKILKRPNLKRNYYKANLPKNLLPYVISEFLVFQIIQKKCNTNTCHHLHLNDSNSFLRLLESGLELLFSPFVLYCFNKLEPSLTQPCTKLSTALFRPF